MIEEASKDLLKFKERNPDVDKINFRICKDILERLVSAATNINLALVDREIYFYVVHNANMVIYDILRMLRKSNYSKQASKYLSFNLLCLNHNVILTHAKYLHWRCKKYVELARSYVDIKAYKAAIATVEQTLKQIELVKKIEEQDPPMLDSVKGNCV